MKILIDMSQIPIKKTGIGIYALNLVHELRKLDRNNSYYILVQDDDDSLLSIEGGNFKTVKVSSKFFRHFILRFLLEQIYIPYLVLRLRIDAVHSLHYSFPLFAFVKRVVTIPDMTFFKFPELHLLKKPYYFRIFTYLAAHFADRIIAISKATMDDILRQFGIRSDKVALTYLGADASFNPDLDEKRIDGVKKRYGIAEEYILFVGTIEPRKNIKNLVIAFDGLLKEGVKKMLVIAGNKGWHYDDLFSLIEELKLNDRIIFTGYVREEEKPYLIAGARVFVYPSIYEGFGIPVLEAISCGVPTVTSNVSSLPEVAGDAALLVDPSNVDELRGAMKRLLTDRSLCEDLRRRCLVQAKKFSWEDTAGKTLEVYGSLR